MSLATLTFNNILINEGQSTVLDSANFDVATRFDKVSGGRFIVDKVSGGHFTLNGKVSKYFTQSELDLGLVKFVDNGNEFSPYFSIRYIGADGVTASNSIRFSTAGDSNSNQFNTFNDLADVDVSRLTFKAYDADPTFGVTLKSSSVLSAKQLKIADPDSNKFISFGEYGIRITIVDSTEFTLEHYVREEGVSAWTEAVDGVTYNEVLSGKVRLTWNGDSADSNIKLLITDSSSQGNDNTQEVTLFTRFDDVRSGGNVAEQLGKVDHTPDVIIALRDGRTTLTAQQLQLFERQDGDYAELASGTGKDSGYFYTVSSVKGGYFELKDSRATVENDVSRTEEVYVKTSNFTLADLVAGNVVFHSTGADNISWKAKVRDPGGLTSGNYNFTGIANSAPVVNDASLTLMVAEDTTTSSRIIATDREGDVLSYSLSGGTLSGGNYTLSTSKGTITLNKSTGFYTYNPKLDATGSDNFSVIVEDNNASTQVSVAVTITPFGNSEGSGFDVTALETAMTVFGPTPPTREGYIYSIQGQVNGDWGTLSIDASTGVYTLNRSTKPDFFGEIDFTIVATNNGVSESYPTTITITNVNDAPVFAISYESKDAYLDTDFALVINRATDADLGLAASTEVLTYTATFNAADLPWLTFDPDTRTFSGKPSGSDKSGAFNVTVTVTDTANVIASDSFTLNVKGIPDKPWAPALDTSATLVVESGLQVAIANNLLTGWYNSFDKSAVQSPAELRVSEVVGGVLTTQLVNNVITSGFLLYVTGDKIFVRAADGALFVDIDKSKWTHLSKDETGTFSFTYKVTDNHGTPSNSSDDVVSYERLVTVTVTGEDDLFTANDDIVSLRENVLGTVTVAANIGVLSNDTDLDTHDSKYVHSAKLNTSVNYTPIDSDPSNGISAAGVDIQGVYGKLTLKADGSYVYTVDQNDPDTQALGLGTEKTETFDLLSGSYFQKSDGTIVTSGSTGATDTSTLTITIIFEDDKPRLNPLTANPIVIDTHGQVGDTFSYSLKFTDLFIDLDGNEGELVSVTDQNGLAVSHNPESNENGIFDSADILMLLNLKSNNNILNGAGSTLNLGFDNTGDDNVDYYLSINLLLIDSQPGIP